MARTKKAARRSTGNKATGRRPPKPEGNLSEAPTILPAPANPETPETGLSEEKRRIKNQRNREKKKAKKARTTEGNQKEVQTPANDKSEVATKPTPVQQQKGTKRQNSETEEKEEIHKEDHRDDGEDEAEAEEEPRSGEDAMKALEEAFAAKKASGRQAKKPKVAIEEEEGKQTETEEDKGADPGDGLDDIFSQLKNKKGGKKGAKAKPAVAGANKGKEQDGGDWFNSRGMQQSGRKYVDGIPVYTEDELRMGKGGAAASEGWPAIGCFFILRKS